MEYPIAPGQVAASGCSSGSSSAAQVAAQVAAGSKWLQVAAFLKSTPPACSMNYFYDSKWL